MRAWLGLAATAVFFAAPNVAQAQHGQRAVHVPRAPMARGHEIGPESATGHDIGPESQRGRDRGGVQYVRGDQWYGHAAPNDPRFHLNRPFPHGRFGSAGPGRRFSVVRVNLAAHRIWLGGGFGFLIAPWEWSITAPWCWNCPGEFVVYDDPDHPGWYLLYNTEFGDYVHVQYMGT